MSARGRFSPHLFRAQSRLAFAGLVLITAVVSLGGYTLAVRWVGGETAITDGGALLARQFGASSSGVCLALLLICCWVRGIGGPLLNLGFLLAHFALTPALAARVVGGPMPDSLLLSAPLYSPLFVVEGLALGIVPLLTYIAGHTLWFRLAYTPAERVAWADEHLPDLYRDTLVDPARFDRPASGVEVEVP